MRAALFYAPPNLLNAAVDAALSGKEISSVAQLRLYKGVQKAINITAKAIGGLFFRDDADNNSADDGAMCVIDGNGKRWKRLFSGPINAQWFGAVGDYNGGIGTDNFSSLQNWINYLFNSGHAGYAPAGNYYSSQTIVKPAGFSCPSISGDGKGFTIFTGPVNGAFLKLKGGSGALANAVISGIGFNGSGAGYGIEVADQCGVHIDACDFDNAAVGILLHNEGGFTEYVIGERCTFTVNCKQSLVYKRTNGTDSFHGSGLRASQINENVGETVPKIEIGGALSTNQNIVVYNAPMDVQVWKQTAQPVIKNNSTRFVCNFKGSLTFETFGGVAFQIGNGTRMFFVGGINDFNNTAKHGSVSFADSIAARSDGSVVAQLKPYKMDDQVMIAGANTIASLAGVGGETYIVNVTFSSTASPWRKSYQLAIHIEPDIKTVTQIAQLADYYGGDLAAPVFSMNDVNLIATQASWPANTVHCAVSVVQTGMANVSVL